MPRNPRARKTLTYDAASAPKDRGVEGLERMGNYDAADDLADESVSEFADRKHIALENSGSGSFVTFHGAFLDEAAAVRKADSIPGAFVQPRTIRGKKRFVVMTQKTRNPRSTPSSSPVRAARDRQRRRNSDEGVAEAVKLYEDFHGEGPSEILEIDRKSVV